MDENKDSSKTNDLDICCDCPMCQLGRVVKGVAEPTPEQRGAAYQRLVAGEGAARDKTMKHMVERAFQPRKPIDWFGEGSSKRLEDEAEKMFDSSSQYMKEAYDRWTEKLNGNPFQRSIDQKLKDMWELPRYDVNRPVPQQTKAQLTLSIFEQLEKLINDYGWNDATDKQIALLRLQECRLLWEADNAGEGL